MSYAVGDEVRVLRRAPAAYKGKRGIVQGIGYRPDGRIFYEVWLHISSTQSTPVAREFYEGELELV